MSSELDALHPMRAGRGRCLDQHADADGKPEIGQDRLQTPGDPGCARPGPPFSTITPVTTAPQQG